MKHNWYNRREILGYVGVAWRLRGSLHRPCIRVMGAGVVGRSGFEGIVAAATVEEVADRFGHDMSRVGIERRTEGPVHEVAILPGFNF